MARPFPQGTFDDPHIRTVSDEELLGRVPQRPEGIEDFWGAAKGEAEPSHQAGPARASKEHLVKFVTDYCDGRVFTSADLRDASLLGMVFLPVALGAFENWSEEALKKIGVIYEYHSKSLPRSVNGQPIFGSMYMLNVDDWAKARKAIQREMALRNGTRRRVEEDLDADSNVDDAADGEHVRAAAERGGDDPREDHHVGREPAR